MGWVVGFKKKILGPDVAKIRDDVIKYYAPQRMFDQKDGINSHLAIIIEFNQVY